MVAEGSEFDTSGHTPGWTASAHIYPTSQTFQIAHPAGGWIDFFKQCFGDELEPSPALCAPNSKTCPFANPS